MEEEGVCGCEIILSTQARGIYTFSFLFPQNNTPPPAFAARCTTEKQFAKSIKFLLLKSSFAKSTKFRKNVYILIIHSFWTRAAGFFLIPRQFRLLTTAENATRNTTYSLACDHQLVDYKSKLKAHGNKTSIKGSQYYLAEKGIIISYLKEKASMHNWSFRPFDFWAWLNFASPTYWTR